MSEAPRSVEVKLHMRHVGLGNAILLELPDGRCAVVDWGTTDDSHHQYLLETIGDREMAFVAATHGHEDHSAGLPWLFRKLIDKDTGESRIRTFLTPLAEELSYEPIRAVAELLHEFWQRHPRLGGFRGIDVIEPSLVEKNEPPVLVESRSYRLLALHPPETIRAKYELMAAVGRKPSENRPSLVLLLQLAGGEASILFGGDAQGPAWNFVRHTVAAWPSTDPVGPVTIVSHHGANFSNGMPKWAIERWTKNGVSLLSTPSFDQNHPSKESLKAVCHSSREVYCSSYADVCQQKYRKSSSAQSGSIFLDQPCFGNVLVTLRSNRSVSVEYDGPGQRQWGFCGNQPKNQ